MFPFNLDNTNASHSTVDGAVFNVGHTMVPSAGIEDLGLCSEPLDSMDEAEMLTSIFGTSYYSTASHCLLGNQEAEFGRTDAEDIKDEDWLPRHPSKTGRNRYGSRVRTHLAFLFTTIVDPHGSSELR